VIDHCILKIGVLTESILDRAEDSRFIEMTSFRSVNRAIAEEFLEGADDMAFEYATFLTIFLRMVKRFTSTNQIPAWPRKSYPWMYLKVQITIYWRNFWYGRHKMFPNCGFIKKRLRRSKN
jgi:hypothetical protein